MKKTIAPAKLDEIDRKILRALQADGRMSNQDLAERIGLSPSPCLRRVKELEATGVIQKYVALVDPAAVGLALQAMVEVRLDRQTAESVARFEKEILRYPQVLACDLIAGDWDYVLRVAVRDLEDFRDLCVNRLSRIPGVGNVKSSISMKQVKSSPALPVP